MINSIVLSSGNYRKVISVPRDKGARQQLANQMKAVLFPNSRSYRDAHAAGQQAKRERN